jgi:protease-4
LDYIETEPTGLEKFFKFFDVSAGDIATRLLRTNLATNGIPPQAAKDVTNDMLWLADMTDRTKAFSVVTHCMCSAP